MKVDMPLKYKQTMHRFLNFPPECSVGCRSEVFAGHVTDFCMPFLKKCFNSFCSVKRCIKNDFIIAKPIFYRWNQKIFNVEVIIANLPMSFLQVVVTLGSNCIFTQTNKFIHIIHPHNKRSA